MAKKFRWYALKLVFIMAFIFVLQLAFPSITENFLLKSHDVINMQRPWLLITSIFLHGGIVHLLYNMFALALFGLLLEKKIGSKMFLFVFFAGGIFANIISLPFYESSLGASGAIYAVMGMLAVLSPWLIVPVGGMPLPLWVGSIGWIIGNIVISFAPSNVTNIGAIAHLSGLLFGFIAGKIWKKKKKRKK